MTVYRTDPETGKRYAFGGLIGNRTIDDRRTARDAFDALLVRRAGELPKRRLTARQVDHIEFRLGWRADDATGKVACPECGALNLADSGFCCQCGEALIALEGDQGVQPGQTVTCPQCGHMDFPSDKYCVACGEPLPLSTASASARPRRALTPERPAPAVFTRPAASARDGINGYPRMVVARESFIAIDPRTHQQVKVLAGRTKIADGCWLHKMRPSAFQYAA